MSRQYLKPLSPLLVLILMFSSFSASVMAASLRAISGYQATNDSVNVFYRLNYTGAYGFFRVYIDTDQSTGSGFQTGGVGANYLLENGSLFSYTGTGTTWSWSLVKTVTFTNAGGVANWTVARADIGQTGNPNADDLLFQVEAPLETSAKYTHSYSGSGGASISNQQATNDSANVFYRFNYAGVYAFYRVYIDTDQNAGTGFQTGGIGVNYLLENGSLFSYTGTGTTWSWSLVKAVSYTNSAGLAQWTVARADIGQTGNPNADDLLFQVEAPVYTTAKYTHTYSGGAGPTATRTRTPIPGGPTPTRTRTPTSPPAGGAQKLIIPSYFYPCTGTAGCYWDQLNNGAPTVGIALINPGNGPGSVKDQNYADQAARTKARGIQVLGYVYTSYTNRPAADVKRDIDLHYSWYGVNGIFFDEVQNVCSYQAYYQDLFNYVKAKGGTARVILNPGTDVPECYITAGDIIVNFESAYSSYVNWTPSSWVNNYPASRFWHLVYGATQANMASAVSLSRNRRAGWLYITPDTLPNPWDTLPTGAYWTDELFRVSH